MKHPRIGGRKLFNLLQSFLMDHQIKMGRDALFELLSENNLLIKKRKKTVKTTNSYHWYQKYKNKIKNYTPKQSNQLWVSDITYWKINSGFVYLSLITDAFSHKVVGYNLGATLEAIECIKALQMAISSLEKVEEGLIHHSDRGAQYCCSEYVLLLGDNNIDISMTENGDPLENAVAERMNGILKEEYLECYQVDTIEQAKVLLDSVIKLYNEERPHNSIGNLNPTQVHESNMKTEKSWKNYYKTKERKEVKME